MGIGKYSRGGKCYLLLVSFCRLVNRNPYPNPSTPKSFDDTKANLSAATSPESGCFGKSPVAQEEFHPKAPSHVA